MTHARSLREISRDGSVLDENAGSVLSKNQQVEILLAAFGGAAFGFEVAPQAVTGRTGQFLLLLDPGGGFSGRVELLVAALEAAGASRLPAERRYRNRAVALSSGIVLSEPEHAELVALAAT